MNVKSAAMLLAAACAFVAPAYADNLQFDVKNTSKFIISSFQSNEGKGWSKNWISSEIRSGETRTLEFLRNGPCEIAVRVGWRTTDGGQQIGEPWNIDICDAHTVYFDGKKVTYD